MVTSSRPAEHAALDPWADVQRLQEQRALEQDRHTREVSERRHQLLKDILGWTAGLTFVASVILGIGWFFYSNMEGQRENDLLREQEKTAQVESCVALEEPLERSFCLLQIAEEVDREGS